MRLDPDCVRDILLELEQQCSFAHRVQIPDELPACTEKYSNEVLMYHVRQCALSGFLLDVKDDMLGNYSIKDLTPKAHEFLENIRKDTVWSGVKSIAGKIGSTSLSAVVQIASNVVVELIKAQFGLNA